MVNLGRVDFLYKFELLLNLSTPLTLYTIWCLHDVGENLEGT